MQIPELLVVQEGYTEMLRATVVIAVNPGVGHLSSAETRDTHTLTHAHAHTPAAAGRKRKEEYTILDKK